MILKNSKIKTENMNSIKLFLLFALFFNNLHSTTDPYDSLAESVGLNSREVRISRFASRVYDLRTEAVSKYVEIAISPPTGLQLLQKTFVAERAKLEYLEALLKLVHMQEVHRKSGCVSISQSVAFGEFFQVQPFVIVDLIREVVTERSESSKDDLRYLLLKRDYEEYFADLVRSALEVVDGKRDPLNLGLVKSLSRVASSLYMDPEPGSPPHLRDD